MGSVQWPDTLVMAITHSCACCALYNLAHAAFHLPFPAPWDWTHSGRHLFQRAPRQLSEMCFWCSGPTILLTKQPHFVIAPAGTHHTPFCGAPCLSAHWSSVPLLKPVQAAPPSKLFLLHFPVAPCLPFGKGTPSPPTSPLLTHLLFLGNCSSRESGRGRSHLPRPCLTLQPLIGPRWAHDPSQAAQSCSPGYSEPAAGKRDLVLW